MIWAILAAVGVPLWLCAVGVLTFVLRNRSLRRRYGDVPVRLRTDPDKRWSRGHAIWVHDVFGFRASPAAWKETLLWIRSAELREPTAEERKKLHRVGDDVVIATLDADHFGPVEVAASKSHVPGLLGPYEPTIMGQGGDQATARTQ